MSLGSHISKHHRSAKLTDCAMGLDSILADGASEAVDNDDFVNDINIFESGPVDDVWQNGPFVHSVALFYLKLGALHLIPASTV